MVFARVFFILFVLSVSVLGLGSAENSPCWSPLGGDRCKGVLRTKSIGRRVMAGRPSKRGEIPWQVALYRQRMVHAPNNSFELFCGGSIITHQHILTAAHCFLEVELYSYKSIIGDLDKTVIEVDEQEFYFTGDDVYSHQNYNINTDENDIAIIKLKGTIEFNKYAQPITLPGQGLTYEGNLYCTISGWGRTEKEDHPNILQVATIITFDEDLCKSERFYGTKIKNMMLCAGSQLGGSDSCQGDSGGPLVCEVMDPKNYVFSIQYGIVSYGIGCGVADKPGVYTKLTEFHDWINETLKSSERLQDKNLSLRLSKNVMDILGDQEKENICSLPHPTELCIRGKGPADEFCKKIARAAGHSTKPMCFRNGTCTFHVNQSSPGDAYISLSKTTSDGVIHACSNNDLHIIDPNYSSDITDARKDNFAHGPNWTPLGINRCGVIDSTVKTVQFKSSSTKVVGGEITERGQFPWQVGLYRKPIDEDDFKIFCGGSIITQQHILTAAHCFQDFEKFSYKAIVGDYDRTMAEPEEQEFNFDGNEIYSHQNYSKSTHENDLAIIKLKGTIQLNKYAQPICLPANTLKYEEKLDCVVSGWGKTRDMESADNSINLRAAQVQTLPYEDCRKEESYGSKIKDSMFCAGSFKGGVDSCQGDSGGPIVCDVQDPNKHTLIQYGIVSFGRGCGNAKKPGVYTRLSQYQDWIDQTLKESIQNIAPLVSKKFADNRENMESTTTRNLTSIAPLVSKEVADNRENMESTTTRNLSSIAPLVSKEVADNRENIESTTTRNLSSIAPLVSKEVSDNRENMESTTTRNLSSIAPLVSKKFADNRENMESTTTRNLSSIAPLVSKEVADNRENMESTTTRNLSSIAPLVSKEVADNRENMESTTTRNLSSVL
ncbi:hypothetical protein WDU94_011777 [Cyamophila willieti]